MQSRRHKDYVSISPSSKLRNQHRHEEGHDSYHVSHHDAVDRSPRHQRRSLSPHNNIAGSRRILLREGRSSSTERRDYSWHLGAGRMENARFGSPPFIPEHRKLHFDEEVVDRRYEYIDDIVYGDGKSNRLKHVYAYDHHSASSRMIKEKDYSENRIPGIDGHVMMGQKSMPMEDGIMKGSHQVSLDLIPTSNYGKTGKDLQLPSRHMDIGQFDHEKLRYREPLSPDNIPVREFYKDGEKPMILPRDDSYNMRPASHFKGFGSTHFKDFGGTSSGVSRSEFLSSYGEGMLVSAADDYPRNSMKLTESMDFNTYSQRAVVDKRVMTSYPHGAYSRNRTDCDDYLYPESLGLVNDNNDYPSDELHRMMPPRSRLDHEQPLADYDYRELSRMHVMHPTTDKIDLAKDSYRNTRSSTTWDHTVNKQAVIENLDTSRILYAPKHSGEYLDSEYTRIEFGRRGSRDNGTSHLAVTQDHQVSNLRSNYGFGRDAGPQFQKEILQDPGMSVYDLEMQKIPVKRQIMEEELAIYEQSDKVLKRKYNMEESVDRYDPRTIIVPSKQYAPQEYEATCESGEEWIKGDQNALHPLRIQRFDHTVYRKSERTYDDQDHHGDFASEDWLSSQDSLAHARKHPIRYYKPGVRYMKSHPMSGSLNWYNSHQNDKRSGIYRKHKTWKRNDEYDDGAEVNDDYPSEYSVHVANSEPCEDSEEFKQLVHEAFLEFSKKLNLSSAVRRRYNEQGKAGSLFCIVCGRSSSKDFMDTQRLVTHAYMSHKAGLRAQHLGLHKAICVLMGWNTYVPCDTTTWIPDVLPDLEAWAQKEDLMLWPPLIIIHNISMSSNNPEPEEQKVIPIEGVEAFLRGKGFIGGKIKVCLGKPADQSVMLVKFLGTFTGLGIAERLNKYFRENKRGREEFARKTSNSNTSSDGLDAGGQGEKLEERLLYGYMGIADDLDKIDFNTKKWITVKSKKDIHDLADAPVKTDERAV